MSDKLTIKKQFIVEKIDGKTTLFDVETSTFYTFNESGSFIFGLVKKNKDREKITEALVKKYNLRKDKARKDVEDFLKDLLKNKIASASEQKKRKK